MKIKRLSFLVLFRVWQTPSLCCSPLGPRPPSAGLWEGQPEWWQASRAGRPRMAAGGCCHWALGGGDRLQGRARGSPGCGEAPAGPQFARPLQLDLAVSPHAGTAGSPRGGAFCVYSLAGGGGQLVPVCAGRFGVSTSVSVPGGSSVPSPGSTQRRGHPGGPGSPGSPTPTPWPRKHSTQ